LAPKPGRPLKATGLLALLIGSQYLGHGTTPTTTINQVAQKYPSQIQNLYKRNFADGLLHQVQFGANQTRPVTRNGQVYLYNNTTYIKAANGLLYPAQATTNLLGNTRLNIVANSKPLPIAPVTRIETIINYMLDNLNLFNKLFGDETANNQHKRGILVHAFMNENHKWTPEVVKGMLQFFPKRVQDSIKLINGTNVTITPDGSGMSDRDKRDVSKLIGSDLFNRLYTSWEQTNKKQLFKAYLVNALWRYTVSTIFTMASASIPGAGALPILKFLAKYSPEIKKFVKTAKALKEINKYQGVLRLAGKVYVGI